MLINGKKTREIVALQFEFYNVPEMGVTAGTEVTIFKAVNIESLIKF